MYSFSCISGSVYAPAASVHASVTCEFTPMHTPGMGSPTPQPTPRHTPASSTTRPVSAKPVTANGAPRLTESSFTVTRMCDGCSVHAGAAAVSDGVYGEGGGEAATSVYTPLCRLRNSKLPSAATATVQAVEAQSSAAAREEEERHAPLSELICIWTPVMA